MHNPLHGARALQNLLARAALLALLWWALTEGRAAAAFASVVIALALATTYALTPPGTHRLSIRGLLRFVPFFVIASLRGGVDVARRALDPRMPLAPAMLEFPLRLRDERERVLLAGVLSLVPGTVSVALEADCIRLHVLDHRMPIEDTVRRAEARIAAIYGRRLAPVSE